jgi:hypothetical protein
VFAFATDVGEAKLVDQNGAQLACVDVAFTLPKPNSTSHEHASRRYLRELQEKASKLQYVKHNA